MDTSIIAMILGYILVPISSVVTFYAGRHTRHNEKLNSFQSTMEELLEKNIALTKQVTDLNAKVIMLSHENEQLKRGQQQMLTELAQLRNRGA